jgi:predicted tellurium resistance membrane protein TerC
MVDSLTTLFTLIFLEIILGIDNLIFIAIAVRGAPNPKKTKFIGLSLALFLRLLMLAGVSFVLALSKPILYKFSVKDFMFIVGGMFLLAKSALEIKNDITPKNLNGSKNKRFSAILQIATVDLIFSLDSLMAAVGLTTNMLLIAIAFTVAILFMAVASGSVLKYMEQFPELKTLSLALILIIGILLFLEGLHFELEKSYIYFAFFFALSVEALNMIRRHKKSEIL